MDSVGTTLFERLGGEEKLTELVKTFYHVMATDPMAKECFATHAGKDVTESTEKLTMFLSGIMGGPPAYHDKYGHPRLRMKHAPFAIGEKEATQWLYCMLKAMDEVKIERGIHGEIIPYFKQVAEFLRNR